MGCVCVCVRVHGVRAFLSSSMPTAVISESAPSLARIWFQRSFLLHTHTERGGREGKVLPMLSASSLPLSLPLSLCLSVSPSVCLDGWMDVECVQWGVFAYAYNFSSRCATILNRSSTLLMYRPKLLRRRSATCKDTHTQRHADMRWCKLCCV